MIYGVFLITAYLLGSIPFGFWIAKWVQGIDIREHGSKNIGATNVFRVVGKKWGILVFILDAAKGALGVLLPRILNLEFSVPQELGLAITAILGHSFTCWLRFKGGKGVATSFGVFTALTPLPALLAFSVFLIGFLGSRILSIGSLAAAIAFPILMLFCYRNRFGFEWFLAISLLLALFIFYTHRKNIRRLLKGEEKRLF